MAFRVVLIESECSVHLKLNNLLIDKGDGEDIKKFLSRLIQNIAQKDVLLQPEELVLLKLINESNGIKENWGNTPKTAEIQCFKAVSVL